MKIKVGARDAVIIEMVNEMRRIIKGKGSKGDKEIAINSFFWQLMTILDEMEGDY